MTKQVIIIFCLLSFFSCEETTENTNDILGCTDPLYEEFDPLATEDDGSCLNLLDGNNQVDVSIFLYENCPIAQYMTLPLNEVYDEFSNKNVSFTGYFPNILSTSQTISAFQEKYSILFNCVDDEGGLFVEELGAQVYSEVFVKKDGIIVYKGMVDNSYSSLGQWSPADKHYLYDILMAIINNDEIPWESNLAIGCII